MLIARVVKPIFAFGWDKYVLQRETDEKRQRRERQNAEKKAAALAQADKMRYKATKAVAAQNMEKRAERMLEGLRQSAEEKVANLRFPTPCALRQDTPESCGFDESRTVRSRSLPA